MEAQENMQEELDVVLNALKFLAKDALAFVPMTVEEMNQRWEEERKSLKS